MACHLGSRAMTRFITMFWVVIFAVCHVPFSSCCDADAHHRRRQGALPIAEQSLGSIHQCGWRPGERPETSCSIRWSLRHWKEPFSTRWFVAEFSSGILCGTILPGGETNTSLSCRRGLRCLERTIPVCRPKSRAWPTGPKHHEFDWHREEIENVSRAGPKRRWRFHCPD